MGDKIKVGPVYYEIVEVDDLKDEHGELLYGEADNEHWIIRLYNKHTPESRRVTLWHEVLHCFEAVYGLSLSEKQVTLLAPMIVQILQDNEVMRNEQTNGD